MSQLKEFQSGCGWQLDPDFVTHAANCEKCQQFDASAPATAVNLCLEGAVLWKRGNATRPITVSPPRDEFCATKDQVKRAMRYKGPADVSPLSSAD